MENDQAKLPYELSHYSISEEKSKLDITLHNKLESYLQLIEIGITYLKNFVCVSIKKCK